uniref:Uncharacterized protein n=1 Tax=Solanum lycopersicum TaxID=4081 RepID=A0A3Q7EE57_SOLLC
MPGGAGQNGLHIRGQEAAFAEVKQPSGCVCEGRAAFRKARIRRIPYIDRWCPVPSWSRLQGPHRVCWGP